MPLDPQRLARVRAHLLSAAALVTAGCGGNSAPDHTINEPIHINRPPDSPPPSATPTASATPEQATAEPVQVDPAPTAKPTASPATPTAKPVASPTPTAKPLQPYRLNQPRPDNSRPPKP